ncbi:ABC transporter substrate-binding protein [Flavobacterium dauae]|uniref:ABC transporter substrate-binding protein n=1 Tax=Flavobacterium dauae TaxID=1563479 RepID=UPI00101B2731|nr:ABC transporter substrate-binding protein [Flavobacterium dauae]WLD24665.1 ABC transporter substrate-binding protein [Flavobacterium dauae]
MKYQVGYLFLFTSVLFLVSCAKKESAFTDNDVFRYNESANIQTLDPAFARNMAIIWPCMQLFNGLVQLDDSLNVKPDIAKKWIISADGLRYEFTLRNDVYFHKHKNFGKDSTRLVTAYDFEYSFNRVLSEDLASPGTWVFQHVNSYKAVNDSVFKINLKNSFPAFLSLLSMKYASVVPKEITEDKSIDFRSNPIGTGPFQFKIWEENVKLVLRKNPNYYEKDSSGKRLPYLESIAITFLPDKQSGFMQFIQGKIDMISGLDPSYKDELLQPNGKLQEKYQNKIKMLTGPYLNTEYLGFNMNDPLMGDIRIRKALNYGFDRTKLVAYLRNGMGNGKVNGMIPDGLAGFQPAKDPLYNPTKAKELINQVKKNRKLPIEITLSTNNTYLDIAEYLQREWEKLGIKVKIDVMPPSTLRQAIATNKLSFFRGSWIADYPDAENYLSLFYSNNFTPNGPNYTHFKNATYDNLYQQALNTVDDDKRTKLYQQMDAITAQQVPVIILFYDKVARFTQNNIHNLQPNAMNGLNLKYVKKY